MGQWLSSAFREIDSIGALSRIIKTDFFHSEFKNLNIT